MTLEDTENMVEHLYSIALLAELFDAENDITGRYSGSDLRATNKEEA